MLHRRNHGKFETIKHLSGGIRSGGIGIERFSYLKERGLLIGGVLLCALLLSIVSFYRNDWLRVQFIPGSFARSQVIAEVPFEFFSKIKTDKLYERKKSQASNVFVIDEKVYDEFIGMLKMLDEQMENFTYEHTFTEAGRSEIKEFVSEFNSTSSVKLEWQDVMILTSSLTSMERTQVFQECIAVLREIARDGVFSEALAMDVDPNQIATSLNLKLKDGRIRNVRSVEWALRYARKHLTSLDIDQDIVSILFNIVKQGMKPNLVYDIEESKAKAETILKSIKPVRVKVKQGDIILQQGTIIDEEIYETLDGYQKKLKSISNAKFGLHKTFYSKVFYGTICFVTIVIFSFLVQGKKAPSFRRLFLNIFLAAVQLFFLRLIVSLGDLDIFSQNFSIIKTLHFFSPALCAAGIAMVLHGPASGVFVSLLVSVYYTLMVEKSLDFLVVLLLANLVFVIFLRNAIFRIKIMRAGFLSSLIIGTVIFLADFLFQTHDELLWYRTLASTSMCFGSGILMVATLPCFERLLGCCSDITLFELVDYNNPILKKLQVVSSGTYNHSLMTSNIAEQVALIMGASPIVCKTGALYHDIGKIEKAEYFIENQSNQGNLHDHQTPYISTLVIKSHVKDGLDLARKYGLPKIIRDMIQQHHGTTAIQFFYERAKRDFIANRDTHGMSSEEIENLVARELDSSIFRYDGPRPQSKEALIVMLADSIEAASRSMQKFSHQSVENLVSRVFDMKLNDNQFDDCSITFKEVKELKQAFVFTLLSLMHTRISYSSANLKNEEIC